MSRRESEVEVELITLLRSVEMFSGLTKEQFEKLAGIFHEEALKRDEILFSQGEEAHRLYIVRDGFLEVIVETSEYPEGKTIVNMGQGQTVGEMALIDQGARSATVRAATDGTVVAYVSREAFELLCETDTAIGYRVMRNIAADLSFRIRRKTLEDL